MSKLPKNIVSFKSSQMYGHSLPNNKKQQNSDDYKMHNQQHIDLPQGLLLKPLELIIIISLNEL